jgi:O-antigen/teichoic acid export membrane protein
MIVLAATPELLWIMSGHTSAGMPLLVALLSMLPMSGGVVTIVGLMVTMHARPSITGWSTLVAAIVNMLLNIWLIPQYGVYGAAVATAIAAWCIPVLVWRGSQTLEVVQYAWGRIGIAVAWYGVVCAWVIIQAEHVWLRAIGVVVFVVGLLFSRLVTLREVRAWWHDQH